MSKKGENIYKRKDGRWEGRYIGSRHSSGKAKYSYVYAQTYQETKDKLAKAQAVCILTQKNSEHIETELFSVIAVHWLENLKPTVKESTYNRYVNLLNYVLPFLGDVRTSELTNEQITDCCVELTLAGGVKKEGLSPKTVADILSVIRNILQYAALKGKIVQCDAKNIKIKRQKTKMRVLSRSEQDRLCKYLHENLTSYNIGILLCLFSGLRIGELCALRWEDISFIEKTIHVNKTMQRVQNKFSEGKKTKVIVTPPKSACSVRTIPLPEELTKILMHYQESTSGYFLTNSEEKFVEPRTMQYRYKKVLGKCSVAPANFHSLRHTFATRCIELGFDVKSLSEILGHASVNITMNRYIHPSMELKMKNMQKLSELLAVK